MFNSIKQSSAPSVKMVANVEGVDAVKSTFPGASIGVSAALDSPKGSLVLDTTSAVHKPAKRSYLNALAPEFVPFVKARLQAVSLEATKSSHSTPVHEPNPFVIEPTGGYRASNGPQYKKLKTKVGHTNHSLRSSRHKKKAVRSHGIRQYRKPVIQTLDERLKQKEIQSQHKAAKLQATTMRGNGFLWTKSAIKSQQKFEGHTKSIHDRRIRNLVKSLKQKGKDQTHIDMCVAAKRKRNSAELYAINASRMKEFQVNREQLERRSQALKEDEVNSRLKVLAAKQKSREYDTKRRSKDLHFNRPQKDFLNSSSKYKDFESYAEQVQFEDELKDAVLERCRRQNSHVFGRSKGKEFQKTLDDCISRRERRQFIGQLKRKTIEANDIRERCRYENSKVRRISDGISSMDINNGFSNEFPSYRIYPDVSYDDKSKGCYFILLPSQESNDKLSYCFPFVLEAETKEQKSKFKLPDINVHNVIEWKESVLVELRAENPNYTVVLQYDQSRWYSSIENNRIRLLLNPVAAGNVPIADLHAAVIDPQYRRPAATAAYNLLNFNEREEKYNFFNSKLYGLIEKSCSKSLEAVVFLKQRMARYIEADGDLTNLNGKLLLVDIVELFKRDTIRTKGEKVKTFYNRLIGDQGCRKGMELCTVLEKDSIELLRLEEFTHDSVGPKLIDRFIDAINEDPKYNGLVGHLRTQREDAVNGLIWTRLKAIVKKDDIDRDADNFRKQKRSREESRVKGDVVCSNCGKRGHLATVCRKPKGKALDATKKAPTGAKRGKYGEATKPVEQVKPWKPRCFKCGGPHLIRDCGLNRKGSGEAHPLVEIPSGYYSTKTSSEIEEVFAMCIEMQYSHTTELTGCSTCDHRSNCECVDYEDIDSEGEENLVSDDESNNGPKRMRAAVDELPTYRQNNDDEDNKAAAISCDECWEELDYLGTSPKSDKHLYVDDIYINCPNVIGCAKVAFEAHSESKGTVSLLDSGASKCMFRDRCSFDFLRKANYGISTASSTLRVMEAGPVKCIQEAYYLPNATHDLISIGDLDDLGCRIEIEGGTLSLSRNGHHIIDVGKSNNVWTANTLEVLDGVLCTMSVEEKADMWWLPKS